MINDSMATESQIRKEIMSLPINRRSQLLQWLIKMDKRDWDHELEEDFSGKGPGVPLLDQVKEDFRGGRCNRWKQFLTPILPFGNATRNSRKNSRNSRTKSSHSFAQILFIHRWALPQKAMSELLISVCITAPLHGVRMKALSGFGLALTRTITNS